ncbi:MAG TPA: tripartite tricarboxylate transporter TctB family protein [Ramlibacter sp.]|nr:tripartite tricarboxylate transporter TctB family protein [Ramlibacter sp.]
MDTETPAQPSPRSDLISGGVWMVIGVAIAIGSWTMDRLEKQGVPAFAAPGLVPGVLGVLIALTALAIVLRSVRRGALRPEGRGVRGAWTPGRAGLALVLCLGFAAGLVGHGLPFWAAASIYLFLHIFLLQWPERRAANQLARGVAVAAAVALGAGVAIAMLFQYAFLVRLP